MRNPRRFLDIPPAQVTPDPPVMEPLDFRRLASGNRYAPDQFEAEGWGPVTAPLAEKATTRPRMAGLLDPLLLVGLVVPVALLLSAMRVLAPIEYERTRRVRRVRGRLSSQVADTMLSTAAIRSAGGSEGELQRIEKHSNGLVTASIERAKVAGAIRGVAATTSAIATAMVIGFGLLAGLPTHIIAAALTIVGFLATPINDLGRVVEYRQTYRAARRILGPAIDHQTDPAPARVELAAVPSGRGRGGTVIAQLLELTDGTTMPQLAAQPGSRIVVHTGNGRLTSELLERIVGLHDRYPGVVVVGGRDLSVAEPKGLRRMVGYAAQGMMLVRGTVSLTARYRSPDTSHEVVARLLGEVGLAGRVAELALGPNTLLVHGGEPLTISERARLLLARSILDDPPLLVFDHLDADLGRDGRATMHRLLKDYPGVVILASDDPDQIVTPTHIWRPEGVHRVRPTHPPADDEGGHWAPGRESESRTG